MRIAGKPERGRAKHEQSSGAVPGSAVSLGQLIEHGVLPLSLIQKLLETALLLLMLD